MYIKILLAILCAFVLWCIFIAIDTAFLPKFESKATIIDKVYHKSHTTMISNPQPNGGIALTPVFHPAKFILIVRFKGVTDSIEVLERHYNYKLDKDKTIIVEYTKGRISGKNYLTGIIEK